MITKEHAQRIAKKLKATIRTRRGPHDIAVIEHNNKHVLQFGIRRGSRKDQGHDHIPGDIHLSPHESLLLAQCPLSREDWIQKMKQKGVIAE